MTESSVSELLWNQLSTLRRTLHSTGELSGQEARTAHIVAEFLGAHHPDQLLTQVGGFGVVAAFEGRAPGPTILLRCELDALPRDHADDAADGAMGAVHRCGHDGHMSIVAGMAPLLAARRPARGRVLLVFQPAEETGEGAAAMLADPRLRAMPFDHAIALHNMPGYPLGTVIHRSGVMACASVGLELLLTGRSSHAAEPHKALCPARALSRLLVDMPTLASRAPHERTMATVTHAQMGDLTFGVTPGYARMCITLRAESSEGLCALEADAERLALDCASCNDLVAEIRWHDRFPATENAASLQAVLAGVAAAAGVPYAPLDAPLPWSDDFGHFAAASPSLYFGLGIGESAAGLHQPQYSFPDEVMSTGVRLLSSLVERLAE